ncbi:ABC transporter ATP-binding protein [Paenibacillus sp. J31TS4]|uniref:ABC transporter ATP-binding protein n=1 Tax=Paenibacillus sp. J31TS4 TaxID=2807195 RepID=UPI001B1A56A7|nr:ABC transporter ATP-binding protein [Paenibacillus sp. J31TS4]GIP40013.1 ABC transporter ATP-binding protein [Paenibacillus sp. J31TS4]
MPTEETVVRLENVSKTIGGAEIIRNLSFSVKRGEIYGFLGPNGSGKTTTIRMMVGLISMTKGTITIAGHDIRKERGKAMAHVGAIVENPELYGYMSGRKNLLHFARMSPTPVSAERMAEVVRLVDLEHAIDKKVRTYSLGMKQRLGIAQALLHHPSILILDEPTNGLDPAGIRQLRDYLRLLARTERLAIIVSSHLLSEIELMCDRVLIIQEGRLVDERLVHPGGESEDRRLPVRFEVSDGARAAVLLQAFAGVLIEGNQVTVELGREEIPELVTVLTEGGLRLYQIRTLAPSLEDTFLELTKGGGV